MVLNNNQQPNNDAAIKFLQKIHPEGPWVLTAIPTTKKGLETKTFWPHQEEELQAFLSKHNGVNNIYFLVNTPVGALNKKASREDIKTVDYFHVDIDPEEGQDLKKEQERCLDSLTDKLPKGIPAPTCIVFSGGGYQAFWKLEESIQINGDTGLAEETKLYNKQLETVFGADHCHNVDRIMRLPGTINIPDAKKLKKGRTRARADLLEFNDNTNPITAFKKYQEKTYTSQSSIEVSAEGEIPESLENFAETYAISKKILKLIQDGKVSGKRYDSRSEAVFAVICNLKQNGVPDNVIVWVLTNPAHKISERPLEQNNPQKYVLAEIDSACKKIGEKSIPLSPEQALALLNNTSFVVENEGGHRLVCEHAEQPIKGKHIIRELKCQSFEATRKRYMNQTVITGRNKNGKPIKKKLGDFWLEHPQRRQYKYIEFLPKGDAPDDVYNLWQGHSCEPKQGEWPRMKQHIREILANNNEEAYSYIIRWVAWTFQNPDEPAEVALVFRGGQGTGKGIFARALVQLFGTHGLHISSPSRLTGNFNGHLRACVLLFADEVFGSHDKQAHGQLKALITEPYVSVEQKGKDVISCRNHLHIVMASNEDWVFPAAIDERRFAAFDVSNAQAQNEAWFKPIIEELENGGLEAMLYDFLNMDLNGWKPRQNIPQTALLTEQREQSLPEHEALWLDALRNGVYGWDTQNPDAAIITQEVIKACTGRRPSLKKVGEFLKSMGCTNIRTAHGRGWLPPSLTQARKKWDAKRFPMAWDDTVQEWDFNTPKPDDTPF